MNRSTFFKSLFGIVLIPVTGKLIAKENKIKRPFLDGGIINGPKGLFPKKEDFSINGKDVTDVKIEGNIIAIQFDQEIYKAEPYTLKYNK